MRKGVEYEGTPETFPGGISIPKPKQATVTVSISSLVLKAADALAYNIGGSACAQTDIQSVNSAFGGNVWAFPGGGTDHNQIIWATPLPGEIAASPNLTATLIMMGLGAPGSPSCVTRFTLSLSAMVSGQGLSIAAYGGITDFRFIGPEQYAVTMLTLPVADAGGFSAGRYLVAMVDRDGGDGIDTCGQSAAVLGLILSYARS